MLNLRQIEAFRAVMIHKTVTRAAQVLYVSQPAVSRLIADLEYYIGFELFLRQKGRLVPTPEALAFYEEVERSFLGLERITETARDIREFRSGRLFISAMPALSIALLPAIVQRFSLRYPSISISLQAHSSKRVVEWVSTQQCDVGFIGLSLDDPSVEELPMAEAPLKLVMPKNHPLTACSVVRVEDLVDQPFISVGQFLDVRPEIDRIFASAGIRRDLRLETQLSSVACEMVLAGAGISLIEPATAMSYQARGLEIRDFAPAILFRYSALLPAFRPASRLATEFIKEVHKALLERVGHDKSLIFDGT
ncbi:LysR substrate-binding domain-containing protein [Salinicola rhizosphaerae]|uniref:Transcriptional regulator n=1 Tax=Salinicola rhizosphaerae TaxID=1443141 RepID=A0ABQ3E239_9GAMM|nr:LysR substrate-binding domain-containing protein [Salinicola rhizosphaerae]GHB23837.1 transcriptional regulator [Salinicola rhizosphaerae]